MLRREPDRLAERVAQYKPDAVLRIHHGADGESVSFPKHGPVGRHFEAFFKNGPCNYGSYVCHSRTKCCNTAVKSDEVLLKWRGKIAVKYMEVIDMYIAEAIKPLEEVLDADSIISK